MLELEAEGVAAADLTVLVPVGAMVGDVRAFLMRLVLRGSWRLPKFEISKNSCPHAPGKRK